MYRSVLVVLLCLPLLSGQSKEDGASAHLQRGVEAQKQGDPELAIREFRKALELNPGQAEGFARLGMVYQDAGRLAEAAQSFEQALKLRPGLPGVGLLLAFSYQGMGKNREAIPYLAKALENETELPVRILAGQRLVEACFAAGDSEQGLATVQKLRKLAPNDPDVLYTASKVYANLWNGAVETLLNTSPGSYRVHQVFAEVFEAQDRFADAAKEYRQIIQMQPNLPGAHYRLGRMILRTGDTPENDREALAEFRKELEIAPFDVPTYVETGDIYLREQNLAEAEKSYASALRIQADSVPARVGLAKVFLARKQEQKALDELERAVRLAPGDETIQYNLMLAYRALKRPADAQRAYAEFQKIKAAREQSRSSILNQLKGVPVQSSEPKP